MSATSTDSSIIAPAEARAAERNGAATGRSLVNTVTNAGNAIASTARSGERSVSSWWNHVYATYQEKGFFAAIGDAFSGITDGIGSFLGSGTDAEGKPTGINIGSLSGTGIGAFLGWLLGSSIGGIPGMIVGALAALCGGFMGAQAGDKYINPMLGRPSRGTVPATGAPVEYTSPQPQQQTGVGTAQNMVGGVDFTKIVDRVPPSSTLPYDGQMLAQYSADVRMQNQPVMNNLNGQLAGVVYSPNLPQNPQGYTPSGQPGYTMFGGPRLR